MTPEAFTKDEANYSAEGEESPCSACVHFIAPDSCALVKGTIAESATCDLFEATDVDTALFGGS